MFEIEGRMKGPYVTRTSRFPEDMFETLQTLALQNNISFNTLVLQCCKFALDNMKEKE